MLSAAVAYECECRRRWTLSALFYCSACHAVRCPHPTCTSESTEAFVCPSCLFRFHTAEALEFHHRCSKCFECTQCGSRLALRTDPAPDAGGGATSFFSCSHCMWDSTQVGLTADSPDALTKLALDAELHQPLHVLASRLSSVVSGKPRTVTVRQLSADPDGSAARALDGSPSGDVGDDTATWFFQLPDAAAAAAVEPVPLDVLECTDLTTRRPLATNLTPAASTAPWQTASSPVIPRIPLLAKCGRRCRACIDAGDPSRRGILLKPNMASFTRDSAPILGGVGSIKWFDKHSSAMEVLPTLAVRVVRVLDGPHGASPSGAASTSPQRLVEVLLSVANPVDSSVSVQFAMDASVAGYDGAQVVDVPTDAIRLEGFDELAEQDALHMRRRKGGGDDAIPSGREAAVIETAGFEALVRVIVAIPSTGDAEPLAATSASFRVDVQYEESVFLALSGLTKVPQPALDAKCALVCPVQLTLQPPPPASPLSDLLFIPLIPLPDGGGSGRAPGDVTRMAAPVTPAAGPPEPEAGAVDSPTPSPARSPDDGAGEEESKS